MEQQNPKEPLGEAGPQEPGRTAAEGPADTLNAEQLAELKGKAAQADASKDQLLRVRAELQNYRTEARKQSEAAREEATAAIAHDVFFVLDDIDRALDHMDRQDMETPLGQGFLMVRDKLLKLLSDRNIRSIETAGELFDPAYHEAVAVQPAPEAQHHAILEEVRRGYMIGSRVLRASQVRVAVRPQPAEEQQKGE